MNWDQIEGNWEKLKGQAKQSWAKLTDDDLALIKGKKQELAGKIQSLYGYSKERTEEELQKFAKSSEKLCGCDSTTKPCSTEVKSGTSCS